MTRKDYELIAAALRSSVDGLDLNPEARGLYAHIVSEMDEALRKTNPSFQSARFVAACGLTY